MLFLCIYKFYMIKFNWYKTFNAIFDLNSYITFIKWTKIYLFNMITLWLQLIINSKNN